MPCNIQPLLSQDTQRQMEPRRFVKHPGQGQQLNNASRKPLSLSNNNRSGEQGNTDKQRVGKKTELQRTFSNNDHLSG